MEKVDHIGIAVRNIEERITYYTETLGLKLLKMEEVESQQVKVAFIDAGNVKIELLEPMSERKCNSWLFGKARRRHSPCCIWRNGYS